MKTVFVYFNLHKKMWSIRDQKTRKVIGHANQVILFNARPKVSESGRQRVIAEGRKNVHAGIIGELFATECPMIFNSEPYEITYNPYKYSGFVLKNHNNIYYTGSEYAYLDNKQVFVWSDKE